MEPPGLPPTGIEQHINKMCLTAKSARFTELGNTAVRHYNDFTVNTRPGGKKMAALSPLELEVARLIISTLNLEGIVPEEIDPEAPLFGEGLGLDSIDALELALAISSTYGFQLRSDDADNTRIFASLRALSRHIEQRRTR
jgi:acyl carrier protein